jgi:seryl-tRNA synthetase
MKKDALSPMARNVALCACVLSIFVLFTTYTQGYASDGAEIKATDKIKNNPVMMQMLKKIEQSKKILAEMQEKKRVADENAQKIQETRKAAQAKIDEEINRMKKDTEPYSPQSAFARFVSKKPTELQNVYWSMFNYQNDMIKSAQDARDKILADGGKRHDAWDAYYKNAATKRAKIIELTKEYNIKYANADASVQNSFDEKGKLPRTE